MPWSASCLGAKNDFLSVPTTLHLPSLTQHDDIVLRQLHEHQIHLEQLVDPFLFHFPEILFVDINRKLQSMPLTQSALGCLLTPNQDDIQQMPRDQRLRITA